MRSISTVPDLILMNARIFTVDDEHSWAQAIAIRKHRVVALGNDDEILALAGPDTQRIDAGGRLVLPGLCDAHIHFLDWSLGLNEVQLAGCTSKAEMLAQIAARVDTTPPGVWITGRGWNESRWGEVRFPTADDLDSVAGADHPAIFWRSDMHAAVANRAAMRIAGIDERTPDPPGGLIERDGAGRPNGIFKELAIGLVSRHIDKVDGANLEQALQEGMATLHRLGVTAIHDQRMKDHDDGPRALGAYRRLQEVGQLQLRINCNVAAHDLPHLAGLGLRSGFGDDSIRLGHVKVFTDGSLGSRTAWMLEPFVKLSPDEADNRGVWITPPEQMAAEFRRATELGFPISVHAIGDRANRVCLDIFEELADAGLAQPIPHRIEHVQTIHPDDLPRLAGLDITASVQPIHATDDMDSADLLLGPRGAHTYNFRSLIAAGTRLAFGSDAPVANPNPMLGIHAALCRQRVERMKQPSWYADERISLEQAIRAYTIDAARAAGWERSIGSLAVGKRADLIMLDRNLFEVASAGVTGDEIATTEVLLTIFDGQIVYESA
ncbi:MAG: amidohydrolase [Caldilineaceae bacterium]|nr:amidohydrolase [Caldilineaceae bacterium]